MIANSILFLLALIDEYSLDFPACCRLTCMLQTNLPVADRLVLLP